MLPSARRLAPGVSTHRFHWQHHDGPGQGRRSDAAPVKLLDVSHESGAKTVQGLDLPSVSVERAAAIERDAFAKGYAEGERAGDEAAAARVDAMVHRLTAAVEEISVLRSGTLRSAEADIVRLAIAMAERIVRREITIDPELLAVMARVAIERLGENVTAAIHLHPADLAAMKSRPDPTSGVTIVGDPTVARGGCFVRSAVGTIDLGIDAQMRELSRELLGEESDDDRTHALTTGA